MELPRERVLLIAGHYGSGKTNIAVNLALAYAGNGIPTAICDLDIVNPYYRTKDSAAILEAAGVRLISSKYANSNVDFPALPQEIYSLIGRKDCKAVFDIGGDDRGALALGRYAPGILEENDYVMAFVVNFYRPLTRTARDALAVLREIEDAGGIAFTHLINNSNLGAESGIGTLGDTESEYGDLQALSGLPSLMSCAEKSIAGRLGDPRIFPLTLQKRPFEA